MCVNPQSGLHTNGQKESCVQLQNCSSCPLLRFVVSRDSIECLLLFMMSLEFAQPVFCAQNPERWAIVWLPALALCKAIINKLVQGPKRALVEQLAVVVQEKLIRKDLSPFSPW